MPSKAVKELPPLPEQKLGQFSMFQFTEQQLIEYGQACAEAARKAAIEECADIAENSHPEDWGFIGSIIRKLLK